MSDTAADGVSYAYEDDPDANAVDDEANEDKEHMEKDLWTELDIDEDRDEPVLKVTVVVLTLGVLIAGVRFHCCRRYRALPRESDGSLSPRRRSEGEMHFAPDFALAPQSSPNGRRGTRDSRSDPEAQGFSLDIFAKLARDLAL